MAPLVELSSVVGAGVTLQLQPLAWSVVAAIVGLALMNWILNTRRRGRAPTLAEPMANAVTYVGGGRWTRVGIGGLDVRWPLLRLTAGSDSLYFGPNERWPLARLHAIPRWHVRREEVAGVTSGHSVVHLKLKDGQNLLFSPVFVRPKEIIDALAARGYPAESSV